MIHIFTLIVPSNRPWDYKLRHEYWEVEKYNLPNSDKDRKPYYVCYTY